MSYVKNAMLTFRLIFRVFVPQEMYWEELSNRVPFWVPGGILVKYAREDDSQIYILVIVWLWTRL